MSTPSDPSPVGKLAEHLYPFEPVPRTTYPDPPQTPDGRITILPDWCGRDGNGPGYWSPWRKGVDWWPWKAAPADDLRGTAFETPYPIAISRVEFDYDGWGGNDIYVEALLDDGSVRVSDDLQLPKKPQQLYTHYVLRTDRVVFSRRWKLVVYKSTGNNVGKFKADSLQIYHWL